MEGAVQKKSGRLVEVFIAAILGLVLFAAYTFWGGVPTDERVTQFWIQIGILFAVTTFFIAATWHLMIRPLPAGHKQAEAKVLSAGRRQFLSIVLALGGLSLVVGPFWDEIWHRQYGIPFGEDFFWRPHMLLYFGFGAGIVLGFWGLFYIMRNHKGTFQQRFRAYPLVALITLSAGFLMYVVPADPVWHILYGRDLSAWSVPHLLLLISIALIMLTSASVYLSTVAPRQWRGIHRINMDDLLPILMYASMMMPWLQILILDYDHSRIIDRYRPDWLMTANIVATATMAGVIATVSLRRVGAATLIGVVALVMRYAMIRIFGAETMRFDAWIIALAPLIAIDVWMAYSVWGRKGQMSWVGAGAAAAVGMLIAVPLRLSLYPTLPFTNILAVGAAAIVAGLGASWLAHQIGEYVATANKQVEEKQPAYLPVMAVSALGSFVAFVIFFVTTASPPV